MTIDDPLSLLSSIKKVLIISWGENIPWAPGKVKKEQHLETHYRCATHFLFKGALHHSAEDESQAWIN